MRYRPLAYLSARLIATSADRVDALAKSQVSRIEPALPARDYLLHREEGIDLRLLQPQGHANVLVGECRLPRSVKLTAFAVGSISMKSGLNVGARPQGRALILD
jgi:hypothetical protein